MIKRKFMFMAIFLVSLLAVSAVSAAELNTTEEVVGEEIVIDDTLNEEIDIDNNLGTSDGNVLSATRTVSGNTFEDIQKAVDSASSGDTISLSGKYVGNGSLIKITKTLNIEGNGATLDAQLESRIFEITGVGVSLNNIVFMNGKESTGGAIDWWSGDYDSSKSNGILTNCKFINCQCTYLGGAIYGFVDDLIIKNCYFDGIDGGRGGAVYVAGADCEIDSCHFESSQCGVDSAQGEIMNCKGAAVCVGGDNCIIKNSEFLNGYCNIKAGKGGAIFVENANCKIDSCHFENNRPGAVYVNNTGCEIKNCEFINNHYGLTQMDISNETQVSIVKCNFIYNLKPFEDIRSLIQSGKTKIELSGHYIWDGNPLYIDKSVNLIGNGNTIIDGDHEGRFLEIAADDVTISNLNFINGCNDDLVGGSNNYEIIGKPSDLYEAVIYITGNNVCIQNSSFTSNYGIVAPIWVEGNNNSFKNCNFMNNGVLMEPKTLKSSENAAILYDSSSGMSIKLLYNNKYSGIYSIEGYYHNYEEGTSPLFKYDYSSSVGALLWLGNDGILDNCIFSDNFGYHKDYYLTGNNIKVIVPYALTSSDVSMYYGQSKRFTVTLTSSNNPVSNANVKISVNGKTSTVKTDANGKASIDLNLPVGTHNVVSEYEGVSKTSKVTVKSTITTNDATGTYSNAKATATFFDTAGKALASKQVTFKIGDNAYSATTNSNGVASANIPLGVGTYTVTAVNPTTKEEKQFKLTISKATSTTALSAVQNGKSVTLTATLTPSTATGKMTFELNGKTKEASLSNGKASVTFSDLSANTYPVKATYGGDSNFMSSSASASVKVDKVYSITNVGDTKGTYLNSKVSATFLDANGKALANTKVTFKAGGKSFGATTNSNGVATASIDLGVGTYDVTAVNPSTKEEKTFKLTISLPNAKIIPQNLNAEYASGTFTFKLVDSDTNSPLAGKELSYTIYNSGWSVTTDKNGIATIDNSKLSVYKAQNGMLFLYNHLDVGKHAFTIKGDDSSINVGEVNDYFTVTQASINIKIDSYKEYSGSAKKVTITATNAKTGEPMKKVVLHLYLPNTAAKDYYLSTDENGICSIDVSGLNPGVYSIAVSNNDTKNIKEKKVTGSITILDATASILTAESITAVYGNAKYFTVNLKKADGTPVGGKEISIKLWMDTSRYYSYNGVTDGNGQVSLTTGDLTPAVYKVTIDSDGCVEITSKITVKKATPKMTAKAKTFKVKTKTKKYTLTLKTNKNKVMKSKKVTLKVNGKTYSAKTNSKGQATFKITKLTKKGTFKATITYKGDSCYNKLTKTVKITVKK